MVLSQPLTRTFQVRRALLRQLAPRYRQASTAQKTLLLDSFLEQTGYSRKYAIALLNHGEQDQQTIGRRRLPRYSPAAQQALYLSWKATHYVCAKRLLPSLPTLVALLQQHGHVQLTEEERRQVLAMSVSTVERYLRTQRKPCLHGLSATTAGPLCKAQIPVRTFARWEEDRPGFVEMDLVAHCGERLDGSFLHTLTLTDLATSWTECIPLLEKSAGAVLAGLAQARRLFPFPLLGIDTDSGTEFLNAELIAYCEQEQVTFTRGRPGVKNDQCHVEQKNGAVVREAVGCVRLVGEQACQQLGEVYRALRLVVNCFQPSLKLQATIPQGERVRRVYDVAQTPLQRLLASGVLPEERQRELSARVQQIDPLALSEQLDTLRQALLSGVHTTVVNDAAGAGAFLAAVCPPGSLGCTEHEPRQPDQKASPSKREDMPAPSPASSAPREMLLPARGALCSPGGSLLADPWSRASVQANLAEPLPTEPPLPEAGIQIANQAAAAVQTLAALSYGTSSNAAVAEVHESGHVSLATFEQALAVYLQELRLAGRSLKTLQWHQSSLGALRRSLWRQFHLTGKDTLTRDSLQAWLATLANEPAVQTGARRTMSTVAAYARSARAFCNWLVQRGYLTETLFPSDAVPHVPRGLPHPVESEVFVLLLRACQLPGEAGGQNAGLTARNRAILWLLWDTGLSVSELCSLRLADVDRASGTVRVRGKKGNIRTLPLSAEGQRAVCAYLEQARLTPTWEPAVPEVQDRLLLTERKQSLSRNSLTLLFMRLSQRVGFIRTPICPSMLRDTYATRFLQAGGDLQALQEQLGLADLVSVKRYQRFCEQQRAKKRGAVGAGTSRGASFATGNSAIPTHTRTIGVVPLLRK